MIFIKAMEESDVKNIADLEKITFSLPWSENSVRAELSKDNSYFAVMYNDSKFIGYGGINWVLDEGYVQNIAICPEMRGRGYGKAVMTSLIEKSKEENLSFLSLEVRVSNEKAKNLYKSLGFKSLGVRKNFYENPTEDGEIMTLYFSEENL